MEPNEEMEIRDLMKKVNMKKIPEGLLENYESEVLRKIKMEPGISYGFVFSVAAAAAVCVALGTWIFIARVQPAQNIDAEVQPVYREIEKPQTISKQAPALLPSETVRSAQNILPAADPKDAAPDLKKIADDLFILEMLGEDEGVLDSMDRAASDIEIGGQVGTMAF